MKPLTVTRAMIRECHGLLDNLRRKVQEYGAAKDARCPIVSSRGQSFLDVHSRCLEKSLPQIVRPALHIMQFATGFDPYEIICSHVAGRGAKAAAAGALLR